MALGGPATNKNLSTSFFAEKSWNFSAKKDSILGKKGSKFSSLAFKPTVKPTLKMLALGNSQTIHVSGTNYKCSQNFL